MKKIATFRAKTYRYLTYNIDENKKSKDLEKYFIKTKLKFEDKYRLDETQLEIKINQLEKIRVKNNINSLNEDKNNKSVLGKKYIYKKYIYCRN